MNKCLKELIFNYIKNRLSDINIYKSCSYKVNVVRVDIFNRIWLWDHLYYYYHNIRIIIMNYYYKLLSLYLEDNLSAL